MSEEELARRFRAEFAAYKKERNERLHKFYVKTLIVFACLGLTSGFTLYYVVSQVDNNQAALCAVRAEAEARIAQTDEFLKENPNGIPGISRETFERGQENQKATVRALEGVNCD